MPDPAANLTPREQEQLDLMLEGFTAEEAADRSCRSRRTVEHQRASIKSKVTAEVWKGYIASAKQARKAIVARAVAA